MTINEKEKEREEKVKKEIWSYITWILVVLAFNMAIFLVGILSNAQFLLGYSKNPGMSTPFVLIGLTQWLYLIPLIRVETHDKNRRNAIITGGIITLLINGSCFGPMLIQQVFPR